MKKLCAQDFNRLVTIERPVETDNGSGGSVVSWVKVTNAWARMRPARGGETMRNGVLTAMASEMITIRWIPNFSEKWRLVFEGRQFNVRNIVDIEEAHVYLELSCDEGVAQ